MIGLALTRVPRRGAGLFRLVALVLTKREEIRVCLLPSLMDLAFGAGRPRRVTQSTKDSRINKLYKRVVIEGARSSSNRHGRLLASG